MIRINETGQFGAQRFDLFIVQDTDAGEITVGVKEFDLILSEAEGLPVSDRSLKERADRTMIAGKIFDHRKAALPPDMRKGSAFPQGTLKFSEATPRWCGRDVLAPSNS